MWDKYPTLKEELNKVERCLIENSTSRNKLLAEISRGLSASGGKRLRPAFAILSSMLGNYNEEKVIPAAAAIEILHMATLVHDDVIDKADTRRGLSTVSSKYGPDMAIYAGDFLFTKAVLLLSSAVSSERLDFVAKAVRTICEGEVDQLCERFNTGVSIRTYLKRIGRKTAILFSAACITGAYTTGCPDDITKLLARVGFYYGIAFQIKDDILDYTSSERASGKPVGNDLPRGILTLPVIYAMKENAKIRDILEKYNKDSSFIYNRDVMEITALVLNGSSLSRCESMLGIYVKRAMKAASALPDSYSKEIFTELLNLLA